MKKVFLCIFLVLGFLLIPKLNVSADSMVNDVYDEYYADDSNMYFYTLPDIMSFYNTLADCTLIYELGKTYNVGSYDIDTMIDNGLNAVMIYSPSDISNTSYSEFSFSLDQDIITTIDLVWYDFYYTPELYSTPSTTFLTYDVDSVTYTLSYYNELGRITTIEQVVDVTSTMTNCFPVDLFDSAYKRNDVVKVSSFVITFYGEIPYFSTNRHVVSNLRSELDLGSIYHMPISNAPNNLNVGTWLKNSLESFLSFEIVPNFALADILALLVTIPLAIWILRMFMGG